MKTKNAKNFTYVVTFALVFPWVLLLLNFVDRSPTNHQNIWPQSIGEVGAMLLVSIAMLLFFASISYYRIEKNHQFLNGDFKESSIWNRLVSFFSGFTKGLSFVIMIFLPIIVCSNIGTSFSTAEIRLIEISASCLFLELLFFISDWSKFVVPEGKIVLRHTDHKLLYPGDIYSIWPWAPDVYTVIPSEMSILVNNIDITLKNDIKITGANFYMIINTPKMIRDHVERLTFSKEDAEKFTELVNAFIKQNLLSQERNVTFDQFALQTKKSIHISMKLYDWHVPLICASTPSYVIQQA
jgi:hypothetical protein